MNKKKMMMFEIMSGSSGGGGADVSGVTATAPDVDDGKIFVDNTGSQVVGTSTYKADYIALRTDIDNLNDTLEPVLLGDGSDTNVYANVSNVTATAGDVTTGKVFVDNTGAEVTGTAVDSTADLIKMVERTNYATITLPSGTTKIGDRAFQQYGYLSNVVMPNTITTIGTAAFSQCIWLSLTSLPSGITSIGSSAFGGCTNLALTSLPSGITSIANNAFQGCTNLSLTSLPSGITSIGDYAFQNCTNLALTSLPSGITSIGNSAFDGCTNLSLTSLPSGITNIGSYAFQNCTHLALTSLPGNISWWLNTFRNCTGLTEITFEGKPSGGIQNAFTGCTNLTTINVPWSEGAVSGAPWGATNATIVYDYTPS